MRSGTLKKPIWDSSVIIHFPQCDYSGTTSAYNERQYFSYLSLLLMSQAITNLPKQPCWLHDQLICPGRHGDLLFGKPNSSSHSKDRYDGDPWDNVLSAL